MGLHRNIFLVLAIVNSLLVSCSSKPKIPVLSDFQRQVNITSTPVLIDDESIGEVVDFLVHDTLLILSEINGPYIFKLFDLSSGEIIVEFINRGRGPNEIPFPSVISKYGDSKFSVFNFNNNDLIFINIDSILHGKYEFDKKFKLDAGTLKAFPINDSVFICSGMFEEGRYRLLNVNSGKSLTKLNYPEDNAHSGESTATKGLAFQSEISVKRDKSGFVAVCSSSSNFEICQILENDIRLIFTKTHYFPEYTVINNNVGFHKTNRNAFHSLSSTDNYIYTIYSGRTIEEYGSRYYAGNSLLVYDWEGRPITHYSLDRDILSMSFNSAHDIAIGLSINPASGKYEFVKYELSMAN